MKRVSGLFSVVVAAMLVLAPGAGAAGFSEFGIESVSAGISTNQAGAHPDLVTTINMKTDPASNPDAEGLKQPYAATKDVVVELPPGLLGNLNAVGTCTNAQFATAEVSEGCPLASQVGIADLKLTGQGKNVDSIYNLQPTGDEVARLGFFVLTVPTFISITVRSQSPADYGVTAETSGISSIAGLDAVTTTLWGVPAAASHDTLRLTRFESSHGATESPARPSGMAPAPFLVNPTSCGQSLSVRVKADSYQEPGIWREASAPLGEITGCGRLDFSPTLSVVPTNRNAASPSGADADLVIPQDEAVEGIASSALRDAVVRLPKGLTISATAAEGLTACSAEQVRYGSTDPANCPDSAEIGTVEIDSPSLTRPIDGAIYQRTPEKGKLFRAWLVSDELGLHIKLPGEFLLDKKSGQITSVFLETPQVPVRELKLRFKGGPNGVVATPRSCGTYESEYELTPWSGGEWTRASTSMEIDGNCGAGKFAPSLSAGTDNPVAGAFGDLMTDISNPSGDQNLARVDVKMPPGVLAKLKGVALCSGVAAATGACPPGSLVGRSLVATGFGTNPLWIPQPDKAPTAVYLGGPYRGAPYSLVVDTPAQAGPFDLGNVVVRVALNVDPATAQVTASSDSLPQMLEGVPITYRRVRIELDRPDFAVNPTSCDPMQVSGVATSVTGDGSAIGDRFQVADCAGLRFKPKLRLALQGTMHRAGDPRLTARLAMPSGANIRRVRVMLPAGEQIDNAHINNPCTRVQFNAGTCPKNSILGRARVVTPLLDRPLEGPVYFRSNGGERQLPDIVADLGGPIHIVLVGFIDSKHGRIRSTFATVPDAPVEQFTLRLFGGKRGLITNGHNLCKMRPRSIAQFQAHNGMASRLKPLVQVSCGKRHSHRRTLHRRR